MSAGVAMSQSQSSSSSSASSSLQATLDHPHRFAAFRAWLQAHGALHVLDLWLAIWAFRRAVRERDPRAQRIGCAFHKRFVSPRTGCCTFLPAALRADCSARMQQAQPMRAEFFDACIPHAWAHLAEEHARFAEGTKDHGRNEEGIKDHVERTKDHAGKDRFARELAEKLGRLTMERTGDDDADIPDRRRCRMAASPEEATMTPERMCVWMERFTETHSGYAFCSSSAYDDVGGSSSGSTTGYMSLRQSVPPTAHRSDSSSSGFCSSSKSGYNPPTAAIASSQCPEGTTQQPSSSSLNCSNSASSAASLTISYREAGGAAPFVARVEPRASLTLRDFRRLFGFPARSNKRFLFKEHCIDSDHGPGASFQWRAIYDDASPLPVFGGCQIVAECWTLSESEDE